MCISGKSHGKEREMYRRMESDCTIGALPWSEAFTAFGLGNSRSDEKQEISNHGLGFEMKVRHRIVETSQHV
jgi:hypothetical protein